MLINNYPNRPPGAKTDITKALKSLVEAGCTEREIIEFARLRARYARIPDHLKDYPSEPKLSKVQKTNLSFYRWLFIIGRLQP
jgi:hypothetical protein